MNFTPKTKRCTSGKKDLQNNIDEEKRFDVVIFYRTAPPDNYASLKVHRGARFAQTFLKFLLFNFLLIR